VAAIPTALAVLAVLAIAILAARPYLSRRPERPAHLIGKHLRVWQIEGPRGFPGVLTGVVEAFDDRGYRVRLSAPVQVDGNSVSVIQLTARHRGYPVSNAARRGLLAVNGSVDGSWPFIARVSVYGV
jgi:hypothetical protein